MELRNTSAVVTGASVGIGRAIAAGLASEGARTALIARSSNGLAETASLVEEAGGEALVCPTDLRDVDAVQKTVSRILTAWGKVNVIANVAGVWHDETRAFSGPLLHETPADEILAVLDVGIRAPMILTSALLPGMVGHQVLSDARSPEYRPRPVSGFVLNISGTFSSGGAGWLHYYVSKKAIEAFTVGLAQELRPFEIQVNCISPADVATEPYKRFYPEHAESALQPEEVAEFALQLMRDSHRHLTGQVIELRNRADH